MAVLGINENHAATAAFLKNGKVVWASAEERIARHKNAGGYPRATIEEGLRESGIAPAELTAAAYSIQDTDPIDHKIKRIERFSIAEYVREMREHWYPTLIEKKESGFWERLMEEPRFNKPQEDLYDFSFMQRLPKEEWRAAFTKERLRVVQEHLHLGEGAARTERHHDTHAAYAYYASPVNRTKRVAVVTADGWGDGENATIWIGENGRLTKVHGTAMNNIARMYRYITLVLGMKPFEHEYKVMGLAPYAKEYVTAPAYEVFKKTLVVKGLDFEWNEKPSDMYFYFRDKLEGMRFDGIAGGLQRWSDELVVQWMTNILKELNVDTLCWSGGLSMNVKTNKAIAEIPGLKELHIPPSGGDESTALGVGYLLALQNGETPAPLEHAYLGHEMTAAEIEEVLTANQAREKFDVVEKATPELVAGYLAKNLVIARCAGRMEFGQRALGNRSILCNPQNPKNMEKVNDQIKFRDFWMPFTPSMLDYRANDYLINPKGIAAHYMTIAFDTTALAREHLPAAIHPADHTARPQIVTQDMNPGYYAILQAFEKETGVGALLNTSFNLHGEPIVRGAPDAWHTFVDSGLDGLLLNDTLILKR